MKRLFVKWRTMWLTRKVQRGALSVNEARARLGLKPWSLGGDG